MEGRGQFVDYSVFHRFAYYLLMDFRLEPFFATVPAASKNDARYNSGQN
jgi:hypothetical protein